MKINTLEEALEKMHSDGVEDLLVQPTHLMQGIEFENIKNTIRDAKDRFKIIRLGKPLLFEDSDI